MLIAKDHRVVARDLIAKPVYTMGGWYNARLHWKDIEKFKLGILCEANRGAEECGDALGRPPVTLVRKARELHFVLPNGWAKLIAPKYKPRPKSDRHSLLAYPYIAKARDEHADILAINAIIPSGIPEHMRADICQEVMLAVLESRTTLDALKAKKANSSYFIKKFYHDNYEQGGHAISFNASDEDWSEDGIASSLAGRGEAASVAPTQFEAAWNDQVSRAQIAAHEIGQFLSREEVEEMMEAESEL